MVNFHSLSLQCLFNKQEELVVFTRRWGWNIDKMETNAVPSLHDLTTEHAGQARLLERLCLASCHPIPKGKGQQDACPLHLITLFFFLKPFKSLCFYPTNQRAYSVPGCIPGTRGTGVHLWGGSNLTVLFSYSSDLATNAGDPQFFLRFQGLK